MFADSRKCFAGARAKTLAKVLGNIRVGDCSRIAAGSVVLEEVPSCKTVAGIPARIVGEAGCDQPSVSMNHMLGPQDKK